MIPKKTLGWVVLRTLGSMQAGGAGESAMMASPPSALGDRWWERGCNCTALRINTLFLWRPRLFPQTFLLVELLTPVPSGTVPSGNSCSLPGSVLPTSLFSNQSTSTTGDRLGCAGLQHRQCVQFLLCPACKRPSAVLSFALLEIFFLSQLISHQSGCYYVGLFCLFE